MEPRSSPGDVGEGPEFSNPKVADDINFPRESQAKSFLVNAAIVGGAFAALLLLINLAAYFLTPLIPFSWEKSLMDRPFSSAGLDEKDLARQTELRRIVGALTENMELPDGMTVTVHYSPGGIPNAFATLGGHIIVFQGLIDLMGSEDELAMVLAHEIAHVKNRDAVRGVVKAMGVGLLLAGVGDSSGYAAKAAELEMAGYSRRQESAADLLAVQALGKVYGHAAGASALFDSFAVKLEGRSPDDRRRSYFGSLTATHPDTLHRLDRVREEARNRNIPLEGESTPLSPVFTETAFDEEKDASL